ncbi:CinA family protein [Corynebacterium silvaticum]|uniref:CinA family protein n=1 Tax=Corynebacterium silvaticum TaxID=2320431 RepID=A0A7Y4LG25_9CORY|nr:CinA family protein [Corynebacterium silvaticum]ARU46332.1 CinA family protein [Corynebacterium silvaticum]MBH5299465.1 CinA family protein [Corynebacterium silvaticum]NOM64216.1 CinA family protein [Corynebacterium silvaticum]NON69423.1 CinA family protein [Corynebacterium silvaticum]TFA94058.1 CinA family protein [Corynebacterium silvaticum]
MNDNVEGAQRVITALKRRGETLAACESLTAGLYMASLGDVPGASAVLTGGFVTYATSLKHDLAGVDQSILDEFGPVSSECAVAMAQGARIRCGASWGVSLTGVAGPDQQAGHPVGEVWIGIASPAGQANAYRAGDLSDLGAKDGLLVSTRPHIRSAAVRCAHELMMRLLTV